MLHLRSIQHNQGSISPLPQPALPQAVKGKRGTHSRTTRLLNTFGTMLRLLNVNLTTVFQNYISTAHYYLTLFIDLLATCYHINL